MILVCEAPASRAQPLIVPPARSVSPPAARRPTAEPAGAQKSPLLWIVVAIAAILIGPVEVVGVLAEPVLGQSEAHIAAIRDKVGTQESPAEP